MFSMYVQAEGQVSSITYQRYLSVALVHDAGIVGGR
jgi:hypothetical protein